MRERAKAISVLTGNTVAFGVCFAVWMMYGVLITFLVDQQQFTFSKVQMGWLIGIPVLTGSLFRLPAGMLADRYGGRPVFALIMLASAASAYATSFANGFWDFFLGGLGFGLAGASFAVGIAYTSVWFPPQQQGTALGVFGVGNTGAALTAMIAPGLLLAFTLDGSEPERWRLLPRLYAVALVVTTVAFWFGTFPKKPDVGQTFRERLAPLRMMRVWRFGLYYFLLFGGFVALSQWLIPYYVNVYAFSVVAAGLLSAGFSLPSGLIRAVGGWLSDRYGARLVMYLVLVGCSVGFLLLAVPRMDIQSPGEGITALRAGIVRAVREDAVVVDDRVYALQQRTPDRPTRQGTLILPTSTSWQEPVVAVGDTVVKRALLARGITHVYFQANMYVFTGLVFMVAILMGIGMAAVYKHIPTYFPNDVGTVGGIVGVLGGLGGFVGPILFGYLLETTGIWTTNWMFLGVLSLVCLAWMHIVIRRMLNLRAADVTQRFDEPSAPLSVPLRVQCPVHGVSARVTLVLATPDSSPELTACSLHPQHSGGPPCEGRCVVLDHDAQPVDEGAKGGVQARLAPRAPREG